MSNCFKTPSSSRTSSRIGTSATPVAKCGSSKEVLTIPASPAMKKMGFGTGVTVFLFERYSPNRGKLGSPWAVKKINSKLGRTVHGSNKDDGACSPAVKRTQTIEEMCNSRLAAEAKLLRSFKHPNIIGFRDYTTAADGTKCLAMEVGERDLFSIIEDLIDNEQTDPLPATAIARVCQDVSSALSYLHEQQRLVHGDLKSANLLVIGDFKQVKICDFGVSIKLDDKMVALPGECYIGTECWSPPEAVLADRPITDKADIFAFGLTIWECLTLDSPHVHVLNSEDDEALSEEERKIQSEEREALFQQLLGTRPLLPVSVSALGAAYTSFLENFYHCTHSEPSQRPSASQLVEIFGFLDVVGAEELENRSAEIDTSGETGEESLNSSYFTNETLALKSSDLDSSEQDCMLNGNEKSDKVMSSTSPTDASRNSSGFNDSLISSEDADLPHGECKINLNKILGEESCHVEKQKYKNEADVTTLPKESVQYSVAAKRPLEEKNELEPRNKIFITSP